ncbi:MAG: hypothetical protein LUB63_01030 [Oscillospiraceae bacterium]|nr:hypothetical protein [Oscillospiraceae bacterium]
MEVEVKYCPKDKNYYLQCKLETGSFQRRLVKTNQLLSNETDPEKRAKLQTKLENLAKERAYMTDYLLLQPEEIPSGFSARRMPNRPKKLVTVDDNTRRWLLSQVFAPSWFETFHASRENSPPTPPTGKCYDFPVEG